MTKPDPVYDIAHLGHVELSTPTLAESIAFLTDIYGLYKVARQGDSVCLRVGRPRQHDHETSQMVAVAGQ